MLAASQIPSQLLEATPGRQPQGPRATGPLAASEPEGDSPLSLLLVTMGVAIPSPLSFNKCVRSHIFTGLTLTQKQRVMQGGNPGGRGCFRILPITVWMKANRN